MHLVPACIKVPGRSRREVRLSLFCACNACNIVNILKCRSTGCGLKRRRKLINDQLAWWRHYHQRLLLFSFLFWKLKSRFLFVKTCSLWATRIKIFFTKLSLWRLQRKATVNIIWRSCAISRSSHVANSSLFVFCVCDGMEQKSKFPYKQVRLLIVRRILCFIILAILTSRLSSPCAVKFLFT